MKFEVLYHFSNGANHLIETKRLDLPASAAPQKIYQWFLVLDQGVHQLTFRSMTTHPQTRVFKEGEVRFDQNLCQGSLLEKDLELVPAENVSDSLKQLLESALRRKQI